MSNIREIVNKDEKLTAQDKYYWNYMYDLGHNFIVPYLTEKGIFEKGYNVAEVGSAEGGVLASFIDAGATKCLGTDIAEVRLEKGRYIAGIGGIEAKYFSHDIVNEEPSAEWQNDYDLVLLRDVIEHLDDTAAALKNIRMMMKPGGKLFVTFPPFHSPYGGHQHTVKSTGGKLPYIHLLPKKIFNKLIEKGQKPDIAEANRIYRIRLTIPKFEKAAKEAGLSVVLKECYFLRPVFKMKFGLPTVKMNHLSKIPFIRKFLTLEASYILERS
jgi:SAM-dependent methyltransferase